MSETKDITELAQRADEGGAMARWLDDQITRDMIASLRTGPVVVEVLNLI